MPFDFFLYIINAAATAGIMALLAQVVNKKVAAGLQREYLLRMPRFYFYLGIICLLLFFVFIAGLFIDDGNTFTLVLFTLMIMFFGGLGILFLFYYKNHTLRFDDTFIEVSDYLGKTKWMVWKDMEEVKFNSISGIIILKSKSGERLKVNQYLVGLKVFLDRLVSHTEIQPEKIKLPVY